MIAIGYGDGCRGCKRSRVEHRKPTATGCRSGRIRPTAVGQGWAARHIEIRSLQHPDSRATWNWNLRTLHYRRRPCHVKHRDTGEATTAFRPTIQDKSL